MKDSSCTEHFGSGQKSEPPAQAVAARIGERARNLYETRQLLCAEAVVMSLNEALDGGLSESQVVALAAPFCVALGESGCMCGALSGAVIASGLFLGSRNPYRHRRQMRARARQLHDAFKSCNGATCCSVLIRKVKDDKDAHFKQCAGITDKTAAMAARMILDQRPELISRVKPGILSRRTTAIRAAISRLSRFVSS